MNAGKRSFVRRRNRVVADKFRKLAEPLDWPAAVRSLQGPGLVAWEEAVAQPNLSDALRAPVETLTQLSVAIGPEGGLTGAEVEEAENCGWRRFTLGPRILRAETAAITAATIALAAAGDLG
ncbi:MAG: RsmE family RNA methyltransferase [Anaerolineales bacterium]|nr:RsmE family RNA methyltransferase [Anaerolineales bacterium]